VIKIAEIKININKAFQSLVDAAKNRYRILCGGAGSGKSYFVAQEMILNMLSNKKYRYLAVRKVKTSIRHSIFQLLTDIINANDLNAYFRTNRTEMAITCVNGASAITAGLNDPERLKSIFGINRIWVEEATETTEKDFEQLDLRLRGKTSLGHQLTMTFNPISELHWLKKRFFDVGVEGAILHRSTYKDNVYIDEAYKAKLERLIAEDYQYHRIYTLGEWGALGNLIFSNWEKQEFDTSTFDRYYHGGDWGFADDPFAAIRIHYDKTRKMIYVCDEIYRTALYNDESAELVKKMIGNERIVMDSAEPKSIAEYQRLGVNAVGARKGQGSVEHGIKWLQRHKIIVHPDCVHTIGELSTYKWCEDKHGNVLPRPVEMKNHLMDALRYAIEDVADVGKQFIFV